MKTITFLVFLAVGALNSFGQVKRVTDKPEPAYVLTVEGQENEIVLDTSIKEEDPQNFDAETVKSVSVYKCEDWSSKKYGEKAINGVVIIVLRAELRNVPESLIEKLKIKKQ